MRPLNVGSRGESKPEPRGGVTATDRQKEAARRNIVKARQAQSARAHGEKVPRRGEGMSTAEQNKLPGKQFAFPKEHKEPLTGARHVRNAIARFDQAKASAMPSGTGHGSGSWPPPNATTSRSPNPAGGIWPRAARTAAGKEGSANPSPHPERMLSGRRSCADDQPAGRALAGRQAEVATHRQEQTDDDHS